MLKYHTIDISCRVIPNEVSLVVNITGCTIKCPGCCERALWKNKGTPLTIKELRGILQNYCHVITCVCFMGGEHEPSEINTMARFIKHNFAGLRTAWYSGLDEIAKEIDYCNFNYLKTGPYQAFKGALGTPDTNQRVFEVTEDCTLIDITDKYIRTEPDEVRQLDNDTAKTEEIVEEPQDDESENADDNSNIENDEIGDYEDVEALAPIEIADSQEEKQEEILPQVVEETVEEPQVEEVQEAEQPKPEKPKKAKSKKTKKPKQKVAEQAQPTEEQPQIEPTQTKQPQQDINPPIDGVIMEI